MRGTEALGGNDRHLRLDFGRDGLELRVPAEARLSVLEPRKGVPLEDPATAIGGALAQPIGTAPLSELARGRQRVAIVVSDITRPVPNAVILPEILHCLEASGVDRDAIEIIVATGLHRANLGSELDELVGPMIARTYRIRNHVARDQSQHTYRGRTALGTEVWVDNGFLAADLRIITGLIEPHLMAGYSGGRKAVVPGLAGVETMKSLHGAAMLEGHIGPGILEGNALHHELLDIVRSIGVDFMLDVTLDRDRRITGVFAGELDAAHRAGVTFLEPHVHAQLDAPADIVVASAGGYPLDATFYQAIKGLAATMNIVRAGGTVVLACELSEGLGSDDFVALLRTLHDERDLMRRISADGFFQIDQWMVQHLCQVLNRARVVVCTPSDTLRALDGLPLAHAVDINECIRGAWEERPDAHIAVLPQGPYTLATVRGQKNPLRDRRLAA